MIKLWIKKNQRLNFWSSNLPVKSSCPEVFCEKSVLKNFVKLAGKNLCRTRWFSCQFCKVFKNTFFIERLRWLLLPNLKALDLQRQWCKWISELLTILFISALLVLVGIIVFIFGKHKFSVFQLHLDGFFNIWYSILFLKKKDRNKAILGSVKFLLRKTLS